MSLERMRRSRDGLIAMARICLKYGRPSRAATNAVRVARDLNRKLVRGTPRRCKTA